MTLYYRGITIYNPAMTAAGSILIVLPAIACDLALTLMLSLAACGRDSTGSAPENTNGSASDLGPVRIATKPMTEQYILGEMLGLLIEDDGYEVEITKGVGGGTSNIQPAIETGEFGLYPEYTSSGRVLVLDQGTVQQCDAPEELLRHPATEFVSRLEEQQRRCMSSEGCRTELHINRGGNRKHKLHRYTM